MLGSVWNFIKRHRRKFVFLGVFAGGVYWGAQYARRKLLEFQELEAAECLEQAKRQHHFDSNQRTCNMTVLAMLPSLKEALMRELDSEAITDRLKDKSSNKLEIWENLKIITFTRTISAVYCVCIVIVFLRVQLNVIGGYMYMDSVQNKDGLTDYIPKATPEVQGQYLGMVQYICEQGLVDLIAAVRKEVEKYLKSISLKEQIPLLKVQTLLNKIRQDMEVTGHDGHSHPYESALCHFMMSPEQDASQAQMSEEDSLVLHRLRQETRDILESDDFHAVLTTCLDTAFTRVIDLLAEYYKPTAQPNGILASTNSMSMPLAKLIPVVNGLIHSLLSHAPNQFVQELLLKEQVKDFAANIYEAFSVPPLPVAGPS